MIDYLWISTPWRNKATFGVMFEDNIVVRVAPIGRWMIGKHKDKIAHWVKKNNCQFKVFYK